MEERRKHPRYMLSHDVVYSDDSMQEDLQNEGTATTVDVSRGGLRVKLKNDIDKDKDLVLKITNTTNGEVVTAKANVVWGGEEAGDKISGLRFTKIGWVDSDKLFTFQTREG